MPPVPEFPSSPSAAGGHQAPDAGALPPGGWRALGRLVAPHRPTLAAAMLLGLAGTATELVSPLVARSVLEGLESGASTRDAVLLLIAVLIIGSGVGYVQTVLLGTLAERIINAARRSMLGRVLGARSDVLTAHSGGELVSRVTSDTTLIREASTTSLVHLVNGTVSLIGTLVLMAYLDLVLLGATVAVIAVGGLLAVALLPSLARAQGEVQEELGQLGGRLEGVARALRTIKAGRAERRELDRLAAHADRARERGVRAVRLEAAAWTLTGAAINLVVLVVLGFGAYRVSIGAIDVPTLVAYLLYVFGLMWPVMMLTSSATQLQAGVAAAARIATITALPQEQDAPEASARPGGATSDGAAVLVLEQVRARYGPDGPAVLDGVSFAVPRRGHTALIGPSGAGKTTVLSLLLRFLQPEAGELRLDGRPFSAWTIEAVRARIGYVEQDSPLVPGTVRDNVALALPGASDAELWAALAAVQLDGKVRALPGGLDHRVDAGQLSGGERQRLAIARVLAAQPPVLLLDEATAQLDARTESAIGQAVRTLARRGAVVSVAHRLSTVIDADQIVVLDRGRVRAIGTHAELLASDALYAELVAALRISPAASGDFGPPPAGT